MPPNFTFASHKGNFRFPSQKTLRTALHASGMVACGTLSGCAAQSPGTVWVGAVETAFFLTSAIVAYFAVGRMFGRSVCLLLISLGLLVCACDGVRAMLHGMYDQPLIMFESEVIKPPTGWWNSEAVNFFSETLIAILLFPGIICFYRRLRGLDR